MMEFRNSTKTYLKYVLTEPEGIEPTLTDSKFPGVDIYSPKDVVIQPGEEEIIDALVKFLKPTGNILILMGKQSIEREKKMYIDPHLPSHDRNVTVKVRNGNTEPVCVKKGDPIAQVIVLNPYTPILSKQNMLAPPNNESFKLEFTLTGPEAIEPTAYDCKCPGVDIYSPVAVTIEPGEKKTINTMVKFAIPHGQIGLLRTSTFSDRSLQVQADHVDSEYRKTVKVTLWNAGSESVSVHAEQIICQMILTDIFPPVLVRKSVFERPTYQSQQRSQRDEVEFVLTDEAGRSPTSYGAIYPGVDIYSPIDEVIEPGQQKTIDTFVKFTLPSGKVGLLMDAPYVFKAKKLKVEDDIIRNGHSASVVVKLQNVGTQTALLPKGEPIAHMILTNDVSPDVKRFGKLERRYNYNPSGLFSFGVGP